MIITDKKENHCRKGSFILSDVRLCFKNLDLQINIHVNLKTLNNI